jgi:hypothetical protein
MNFLTSYDDEGSEAGDTGSAMHKAIETLHKGADIAACIAKMSSDIAEYPKADLQDAANMFLLYSQDNRNRTAQVVLSEKEVNFQIAAAKHDPTQAPIEIVGTLDQVRRVNGRLELWDAKSSKKQPIVQVRNYRLQIAAYCIGASFALNEPVHPGGIICTRKYGKSPSTDPVFWHMPFSIEQIELILEPVRNRVAEIRSGNITHLANDDCDWCVARTPDLCVPKLQETLALIRR